MHPEWFSIMPLLPQITGLLSAINERIRKSSSVVVAVSVCKMIFLPTIPIPMPFISIIWYEWPLIAFFPLFESWTSMNGIPLCCQLPLYSPCCCCCLRLHSSGCIPLHPISVPFSSTTDHLLQKSEKKCGNNLSTFPSTLYSFLLSSSATAKEKPPEIPS